MVVNQKKINNINNLIIVNRSKINCEGINNGGWKQ